MRYFALVEDWPHECLLFFRELPGCFTSASTYEEALAAAPAAIAEYLQWLKANEVAVEADDKIEVVVKERLAALNGEYGPRFAADLAPLDEVELDIALNIAAVARADILELYYNIPQEDRDRVITPSEWSLKQHLVHIVESEAWYTTRLTELPPPNPVASLPKDPAKALFEDGMDNEQFLREPPIADCQRIFVHAGEEWTAAKVVRRMVEHLREHYPWMVKTAQELGVR